MFDPQYADSCSTRKHLGGNYVISGHQSDSSAPPSNNAWRTEIWVCAQSHHMMVPGRYELRVQPQPSSFRVERVSHVTPPHGRSSLLPDVSMRLLPICLADPALAKSWQRRIIDRDPVIRDGRQAGTGAATKTRWQMKENVSYYRCARAA